MILAHEVAVGLGGVFSITAGLIAWALRDDTREPVVSDRGRKGKSGDRSTRKEER
jgi:hypothetical protein